MTIFHAIIEHDNKRDAYLKKVASQKVVHIREATTIREFNSRKQQLIQAAAKVIADSKGPA